MEGFLNSQFASLDDRVPVTITIPGVNSYWFIPARETAEWDLAVSLSPKSLTPTSPSKSLSPKSLTPASPSSLIIPAPLIDMNTVQFSDEKKSSYLCKSFLLFSLFFLISL